MGPRARGWLSDNRNAASYPGRGAAADTGRRPELDQRLLEEDLAVAERVVRALAGHHVDVAGIDAWSSGSERAHDAALACARPGAALSAATVSEGRSPKSCW